MDNFTSKFKNFWFYNKKHLLVALAVLLVAGYLAIQSAASEKPDYHIGLVRAIPCTEEELNILKDTFTAAGTDLNGDGQVLVQIHTYYVDLATEDGQNADVIQALDADLIGAMSGLFLLEDADTFTQVTNNLFSDDSIPLDGGLFLAVRKDASDAYVALAGKIMQPFSAP